MNVLLRNFSAPFMALAMSSSLLLAACGGGGGDSGTSTTNTSNTNPYIAALTDGVGLRIFTAGYTSHWAPFGTIQTATSNGNGSYTTTTTAQSLNGGTWGSLGSITPANYVLSAGTSATWVAEPNAAELTQIITFTLNNDGSVSVNDPLRGTYTGTPMAVDLSGVVMSTGKTVAIPMPSGGTKNIVVGKADSVDAQGYAASPGVISPSAAYPAGSISMIFTGVVYPQDDYSIYNLTAATAPITGPLSTASLSNPTQFDTTNPICTPYGRFVFSTTQPNLSAYAHFDVYAPVTPCAAIVTSGPTADVPTATVDISSTTARSQTILKIEDTYGSGSSFLDIAITGTSYSKKAFIAPVNNQLYIGFMTAAGTPVDASVTSKVGHLNKTAMDAIMDAATLPRF